jgi:hypothetical protein
MIDKITKTCIDKIITEINKPLNKDKLDIYLINPLFKNLSNKLLPYILFFYITILFNLILIIIILILIIYYNK